MKWSSGCECKDLGVAKCVQFECIFALDCANDGSALSLWVLRNREEGRLQRG